MPEASPARPCLPCAAIAAALLLLRSAAWMRRSPRRRAFPEGREAARMMIAMSATPDRQKTSSPWRGRTRAAPPHRARGGIRGSGDIFARYHRLRGERRPHGQRDGRARHAGDGRARDQAGVSPRELADRNNEIIREDLRQLGSPTTCSRGRRRRTTTRSSRDVFRTLYDKGFILEQTTTARSQLRPGRRSPTATSRERVRSAASSMPAAISATTAATSSIRRI